jgi:tetratricopeptide (TPR) repeat protein
VEKKQSSGFSDKEWYEEGRRLTRNGSHREAIEALDLAIDRNPLYAEAYFVRGACHYATGSYQQAGEDLDAAAILGCRDAQFWSKHFIPPVTIRADD